MIFAVLGAICSYATIVLGGTVRGIPGAGLACPDWPLCHGSVVPSLANPKIAVEYAHRLAAALTSLCLFLTFLVCALRFRKERWLVSWSSVALGILATQVGLGAVTIASGLDWVIVTIHLALGTATFATALIIALLSVLQLRPLPVAEPPPD